MAPSVSQLDTTLATDLRRAHGSAAAAGAPGRFSQVRTALIRALRSSPEAREPLCDALEQLEAIQQELEGYQRAMPPTSSTGAMRANGASRRHAHGQEYEIQDTADGGFLTERRPGHSQPFRCPRATYDAAAEVLGGAAEALPFEDLMERLNARTGHRQPDYRLRVALRFWMSHQAVARFRTKYRAADREHFLALTRALWSQVQSPSPVSPSQG